ncbi:MAG: HIT domain-containing protein [Puniceicoccales bacterium]|jgi:ATP adenylyltransferase|nr:HIT domain-containing protein [Puniceicoccales bacterium]
MERLHAYWRFQYLEAPKAQQKAIFEALPKENNDEKTLILSRQKYCYLMLNAFPYNVGHVLAIPYRPVPFLNELSREERTDLMELTAFAEDLLRRALEPDGMNVGINLGVAAGAGIPQHLHVHIVPRWNGDTNFMPIVGDVRVLPIALDEMWKRLSTFL